jgi:hypothetical protein
MADVPGLLSFHPDEEGFARVAGIIERVTALDSILTGDNHE